jgi:hypothetical protein
MASPDRGRRRRPAGAIIFRPVDLNRRRPFCDQRWKPCLRCADNAVSAHPDGEKHGAPNGRQGAGNDTTIGAARPAPGTGPAVSVTRANNINSRCSAYLGTDHVEAAMKSLTGIVAVLVLCATHVADARGHGSKAQTQPPLHGPGSSHDPIVYHPVHGPGSTHNPIVRSPGKTVVRDHRKGPCYIRCHPGHRPDLTNAEGGRAVTTSRSSRYQGGDTSRDHRNYRSCRRAIHQVGGRVGDGMNNSVDTTRH